MHTIAVASDHAGAPLIEVVKDSIVAKGLHPLFLGGELVGPSDDYPDFAQLVAKAVQSGEAQRGIIICGSGVGASVAACKFKGIRACVCHDTYSAAQGVEHDDLNILCLGARIVGSALARVIIDTFLDARFSGEERHLRRLAKVRSFEQSDA